MVERQEDFPIETFRHVERRICIARAEVMKKAAELAAQERPDTPCYTVGKTHIDAALRIMIDSGELRAALFGDPTFAEDVRPDPEQTVSQ